MLCPTQHVKVMKVNETVTDIKVSPSIIHEYVGKGFCNLQL